MVYWAIELKQMYRTPVVFKTSYGEGVTWKKMSNMGLVEDIKWRDEKKIEKH